MKTIRPLLITHSLLLLAILLATTSCKQDLEPEAPVSAQDYLTVTIDGDQAATRAIVMDNPGIGMETVWTDKDQLGIFGASTNNTAFTINASTISEDGRTATFQSITSIPTGDLLAYYPYADNATLSDNTLHLTFGDTQHYINVGGVAQPDPAACVMIGSGTRQTGVSMRNVMAVLKVGQVFETTTKVKTVEFRDLAGEPVCGKYTVSITGGVPQTTFTGTGSKLTLDLGDGVEAQAGSAFIVFLVVPARNYPKGFEITFVDADGQRTVKTAGTKHGKTLNRSIVHPVGDIGDYKQVEGMSYELKPSAMLMTPDKLDLIKILRLTETEVYDDEGNLVRTEDGYPHRVPAITALVHRDLNPKQGGWLIFNMPSAELPQGGTFRITKCKALGDGENYEVEGVSEINFAAPFESLQIGTQPTLGPDGEILDDGGVEIDLAPYVKEIVETDEDHHVLSRMPLRPQNPYEMNVAEGLTRTIINHTYNPPPLSMTMDDDNHCSCEVSTQAHLAVRIAIGIIHGELQYIYFTVNPTFDIKTAFALYAKFEKSKSQHLWTFYTTGVAIGPIVLLPEITFNASIGAGAEAKFSASTTFSYNIGTYGVSYNKGQGLMFHKQAPPPPGKKDDFMPQLGAGAEASVYAFGALGMGVGVSIYAMCSLGLNTDFKLTFGVKQAIDNNNNSQPAKLHLTPELSAAPYTAFLHGKWHGLFKELGYKVEFEPLWERLLRPIWDEEKHSSTTFITTQTEPLTYLQTFVLNKDQSVGVGKLVTGVEGANYNINLKGKTLKDFNVFVDVYEGSNVEFAPDPYSIAIPGWEYDDPYYGVEAFRSAGLLHLTSAFVRCKYRFTGLRLKMRYPVGVFKANTEETQTFSGQLQFPIGSGIPCIITGGPRPVDDPYEIYDEDNSVSPWYTGDQGDIVWYYWPNCSNGGPYPWTPLPGN